MSQLTQSFHTCVGTAAGCFRDSIGVGCTRFLFVEHLLAILELGVSRRVTASLWPRGGFCFGV